MPALAERVAARRSTAMLGVVDEVLAGLEIDHPVALGDLDALEDVARAAAPTRRSMRALLIGSPGRKEPVLTISATID